MYADRKPLDLAFNAAVMSIANGLFPCGYDVGENAPETLAGLNEHIRTTGRMLVSSDASDTSIYACPEHNWAFRAWHDWCHWKLQAEFDGDTPDYPGERAVYALQCDHIRGRFGNGSIADRFCKLLEAEVIGQIEYAHAFGSFPTDQRAFAINWIGGYPITRPL